MKRIALKHGDCLHLLKKMKSNSVDSIVTDPPYGLKFMSKHWDYSVPSVEIWKQCLRVLKPGGHLLAFGGTRTYHRLVVAIEDAGFEIRDQIQWIYGSGFPKSMDISKAIDKEAGAEREVVGTKERPASIVFQHSGIHGIDELRKVAEATPEAVIYKGETAASIYKRCVRLLSEPANITVAATDDAKQWNGWGTALKPATEIVCLASKPLDGKTLTGQMAHILKELICQCLSSAKGVKKSSRSNRSVSSEDVVSVPWNAVEKSNTLEDLKEAMDTLPLELAEITSLNIAKSWLNLLVEICDLMNMSIIETESRTITGLKILKSFLSEITHENITQDPIKENGSLSNVGHVQKSFKDLKMFLSITRELSVAELAMSKDRQSFLDVHAKTASEPICLARKPLSEKTVAKNVLKHGTGGLNIEGTKVGYSDSENIDFSRVQDGNIYAGKGIYGKAEQKETTKLFKESGRFPANVIFDKDAAKVLDEQSGVSKSSKASRGKMHGTVYGGGKGLTGPDTVRGHCDSGGASRFFMVIKKSISDERAEECGLEKIEVVDTFVGRKKANRKDNSNIDGSGSKQTDQFLMGTISIIGMATHSIISFQILNASTNMNIGLCTIVTEKIISKSMESSIENVKLVSPTEALISLGNEKQEPIKGIASIVLAKSYDLGENKIENTTTPTIANIVGDRFFYVSKASKKDRGPGNKHPTVKPTKLMEYLIRMITPPGGKVLDPFMGSGSTGVAAQSLGFKFVGMERDKSYMKIARKRMGVKS